MEPKESILSGGLADKLLANENAHGLMRAETPGYSVGARRCRIRGKFTGGLVIWLSPRAKYAHGDYFRRNQYDARLRSGWDRAALSRALHRLVRQAAGDAELRPMRERVYQLAESRNLPPDIPDVVEGHTTVYEEMTRDDCAYWLARLGAYPAKGAA